MRSDTCTPSPRTTYARAAASDSWLVLTLIALLAAAWITAPGCAVAAGAAAGAGAGYVAGHEAADDD